MISLAARKNSGFTLLELLVVIAVIGILVSVGAASYTQAQKKARDARRVQDMKAIQSAMEQYFANNDEYPIDCSPGTDYLPAGLPEDPQNSGTFIYDYVDCPAAVGGLSYCVCANVEGDRGNSTAADCASFVNGTGGYYCVANLQ